MREGSGVSVWSRTGPVPGCGGWDLYLSAEEHGTRSLGAEDGTDPWVQRTGSIPGCGGWDWSLGRRRTGLVPGCGGQDRSLGERRKGPGPWVQEHSGCGCPKHRALLLVASVFPASKEEGYL